MFAQVPLPEDHQWKAQPGFKIVVANRGMARIEIPEAWTVEVTATSLRAYDRPPPDDDCRLELTVTPFPGLEPERVPIEEFLRQCLTGKIIGSIQTERRLQSRLAWAEVRWTETEREACSRVILALGQGMHLLLTLDYWQDDESRVTPLWDKVYASVTLGLVYRDPLTGKGQNPAAN